MDLMVIKLWIDIAQFAVMSGIGLWMYLERRNDKTNERIGHLERDLDTKFEEHDGRLMRVETQIEHLPQVSDVEKLYDRVRTVDLRTSHMEGEFREVRRTLGLIHEFLMLKDKP
jgi:hypothetical protein